MSDRITKGVPRVYFPKVVEARNALANKALDLFETYEKLIKEAIAAGEFEVAQKGLQFLMEHMPKDDDGVALLDPSIDKTAPVERVNTTPTIKIGIALGGVTAAQLPAAVIDVEPED